MGRPFEQHNQAEVPASPDEALGRGVVRLSYEPASAPS
jgi:hypothetical protein